MAAFVVRFDVKRGNEVAWVDGMTKDEADGLEYKAMASGLDKIEEDYVYFKLNNLFGLAVFHKLSIDSPEERNARFTSTGFMSANFTELYKQMDFLRSQSEHINKNPGDYLQMAKKFDKLKLKTTAGSPLANRALVSVAESERT